MGKALEKASLSEKFDHLVNLISSERFLNKEGLGNEIPFFICPFKPEETWEMYKNIDLLIKQLKSVNVIALEINFYDLAISLLKKRGIFDTVIQGEANWSKGNLLETMQSVFDSETHLIPAISQKMQDQPFDVLFLTGVGEVYPYIRSHNVLNNLQTICKEKPTVLFFPGEYRHSDETGTSLDLFGKLKNDPYYRAFNIYHYEL